MYLASAPELAQKLHESAEQLADPALHEEYEFINAERTHTIRRLPSAWRFSQARIAEMMEPEAAQRAVKFSLSPPREYETCAVAQSAA